MPGMGFLQYLFLFYGMDRPDMRADSRRFTLQPHERLRKKGCIRAVFQEGRYHGAYGLRFRYLKTAHPASRLGMAVSGKYGNAIKRNRLRRLIREGFRLSKHDLPCPVDIMVMPNIRSPHPPSLARVLSAFHSLGERLGGAQKPPTTEPQTPGDRATDRTGKAGSCD